MRPPRARGRPGGSERPRNSAGWLITAASALCVGGYDDHYNVAIGGTDQSTDGAYIVVSAHARNGFAAAISSRCGESDHGHVGARRS